MLLAEIEQALGVSRSHSICVACGLLADFPAFVRSVVIHREGVVRIRVEDWGQDEGGVTWVGNYHWTKVSLDMKDLVTDLEAYLGSPLSSWENLTRSGRYPPAPDPVLDATILRLKRAVREGTFPLPHRGGFRLQDPNTWWARP